MCFCRNTIGICTKFRAHRNGVVSAKDEEALSRTCWRGRTDRNDRDHGAGDNRAPGALAPIHVIPVQARSDGHLIKLWLHGTESARERLTRPI
jgi:hypothetical protein